MILLMEGTSIYASCRKAYRSGNCIMKPLSFQGEKAGRGEKNKGKRSKSTLKNMQSHLNHPGKLDRLQVQNSRQCRLKRTGTWTAIQSASDLEAKPSETNASGYTLMTSTIQHTRRSHVSCRMTLCIKHIVHGKQETGRSFLIVSMEIEDTCSLFNAFCMSVLFHFFFL